MCPVCGVGADMFERMEEQEAPASGVAADEAGDDQQTVCDIMMTTMVNWGVTHVFGWRCEMRNATVLLLAFACACSGSSSEQDGAAPIDRATDRGSRDFGPDKEVADSIPDTRSDGPAVLPDGPMPSTEVFISPAQATINGIGGTTTIEVRVVNVIRLYAFRITLSFDASVVQIEPFSPGYQMTPGDFLDPLNQYTVVNKMDNVAGTTDLVVTQLYPATAKSGDGLLLSAKFKGSKVGSSPVQISLARLLDDSHPDPLEIPVVIKHGQLTVTP